MLHFVLEFKLPNVTKALSSNYRSIFASGLLPRSHSCEAFRSGTPAIGTQNLSTSEAKLADKGLKSRIHRKGHRNKPLTNREMQGNKTRSKVRARVEHVFGAQSNDMGGTLVRSIGLARAKARIGLKNLTYNMRRLVHLERLAMAGSP